ncbi:MAG: hypothetical protein LBL38_00955 [Lactobacillales bacterium]|jgi:hypothetical protein|nr:hypothetical protein [Lactobacillales bacterium]
MNKFLKKALSILSGAFMVASMVPCSVFAEILPNNLSIKNSAVLRILYAFTNQKSFKKFHTDKRYLCTGSISGTELDLSKAVFVLNPDDLSHVTIIVPERNKLKRLVGQTIINTSLNPNPENVKDVVDFFNSADSSAFDIAVTNFRVYGEFLPAFIPFYYKNQINVEGLSLDEPNSRFYLEFGEKLTISLKKSN